MCGLAGFVDLTPDGSSAAADGAGAVVRRMTRLLAHRGPDDAGFVGDGPVRLGFRRLAIVDVEGGHQPLTSADGQQRIVFNGEIYNDADLREELEAEGEPFATRSDTEVILAAYRRWGPQAVRRLRGMFAFVVWDERQGVAVAARDRFGIKPLYYRHDGEALWFASEVRVLAAEAGHAEVDAEALEQYLRFQYVPEPATAVEGIRALPPGSVMVAGPGTPPRVSRYWSPRLAPQRRRPQVEPSLRAALRDSVRVHLRSDVPVGAFLSGGIDSTAVVALAREFAPDLQTFSVGFEEDGYSELELARRSARALGVDNVAHVVTPGEFARHLPRIVGDLDVPVADPAAVPLWFLAREARRHVKVVLSGEGADELFGGYPVYHQPAVVRALNRQPAPVRRALAALATVLPEGRRGRGLIERATTPLEHRYLGNARIFREEELDGVLGRPARRGGFLDVTGPAWAAAEGVDDATAMQTVDLHTWLVGDILTKADRMTMAHGLELRVPYLDPAVFAVAATLARKEKVGGGTTKRALRRALAGDLPEGVAGRAKLGFPVPLRRWLAADLHDWAAGILAVDPTGGLLRPGVGLELLERHRAGRLDLSRRIWTLLVWHLWCDQQVRARSPSGAAARRQGIGAGPAGARDTAGRRADAAAPVLIPR